jgi:hypothetical protein
VRFRSIARTGFALTIVFSCVGGLAATATAAPELPPLVGYWGTDAAGLIRRSGDAPDLGDLRGLHLNAPIVGIAATSSGRGFWLAAADGGVFSFGDARFFGSAANLHLNAPIVGIAALPGSRFQDRGYWLAAADGGVFTFGDAKFYGSAATLHLNAPIVGIASNSSRGYLLAASDGGVFTFGDTEFFGSAANLHLNAPVVGIIGGSGGYRLAASDGGVFTYGYAAFFGTSTRTPVSAITRSPFGGYVMQSSNGGGLSAFGNGSSCVAEVPAPVGSTHRYVGVAGAFDPGRGDEEGAMANVSCPVGGGHTGAFRPPRSRLSFWHIDVATTGTGPPCFTEVFGLDRVGTQPVPTRPLVAKYGSIEMRSTQTAGHSVFDVRVTGTNCRAVASVSVWRSFTLPLAATTRVGDLGPFSALLPSGPFTLNAHGTCTTEVRESRDGRLLERETGSSYTMTVPSGGFWISNTPGCTVSVT